MLLHLSSQLGQPQSGPALPCWKGVWSKCCWISHVPRLDAPPWLRFCLSAQLLSASLPGTIAISSLGPRSLSSPIRGPALVPSLPTSRAAPPAPRRRPLALASRSIQRGCAAKAGGPGSFVCSQAGEGVPQPGCHVAWQHISLSSDSHVPLHRLLMQARQMRAILQRQLLLSVYLLFTIIAIRGFVNVSSCFLKRLLVLETSIFQPQIEISTGLYSEGQKSSVTGSRLTASNCGSRF